MKNQKQIFLIILVLILLGTIYYFELPQYLTLEHIKQQKDALLNLIEHYYLPSVIIYILLYCFVIALSLPGAAALSLLGGFLFGTIPGLLYILCGATSGAIFAFLAVRYSIGKRLQKKYAKQLTMFNKEIQKHGAYYLFSLRLIPIFPFFLINILAGFTEVPLKTFFITTFLGIIPGAFVFSFAGKQLQKIDKPSDVFSSKLILAFCLLALFALLPVIYKKLKKNSD